MALHYQWSALYVSFARKPTFPIWNIETGLVVSQASSDALWRVHQDSALTLYGQEQASIPQPMEVEAVEKASASSTYGHGSGILGALSSNALASKPAGSNMQRLGSKMVIPSAIDSSGLIDVASISRQPHKQAASASGVQLTAIYSPNQAACGCL